MNKWNNVNKWISIYLYLDLICRHRFSIKNCYLLDTNQTVRHRNVDVDKSSTNKEHNEIQYNNDKQKNTENSEASQRFRRIILLIIAVTVHNIPGKLNFILAKVLIKKS